MKKILIISSSPRRGGNSDTLADEFLRGTKDAGHDVEKIFLRDKKIAYCTGCGYCFTPGHDGCAQKDDMQSIAAKMKAADVIVLATPVYFYSMCGQLKTMIDRLCAYYADIGGKEFYYILAAQDSNKSNSAPVIAGLRAFLFCLDDPKEKGIIYGLDAWHIGDIKKNVRALSDAYTSGKSV